MARTIRITVLSALLLAAGAASAQQIVFFELPDFNGRRYGVNDSVSNMSSGGFNDRASSVVVRSGNWQLCTDAYFRGRCVTLNPGEYRNLGQVGLANQISSARQLGGSPGGGWSGGGAPGASVTLYEDTQFGGRSFGVSGDVPNLGRTDFNDRARSIFVEGGTWELCRDDGYRGGCQTFGPGRHPDLGPLAGAVSSIRRVGGGPGGGAGGWNGSDWPDGWGNQGRVLLYEQTGFGGRRIALTTEFVPNFSSLGFNDRASSLRIERGYWMFCSDASFQGTCRTFGPGDYPTLPAGLDNRISSGRRISEDYPYQTNPNWSGYTQQ